MRYLLTIFREDDLPKINHMGSIMVDYNHMYDMEERGFTPIHKRVAVSKAIFDAVPYAPITYDNDSKTKYATDKGIELGRSRGYFDNKDYEELQGILAGTITTPSKNIITQEDFNRILEENGGEVELDELIDILEELRDA